MANHTTLPTPWSDMARAAGGVERLCNALDVGRMTLWKWAHKKTQPGKIVQGVVNAWAFQRGIAPPFKTGPKPAAAMRARR